MLKLLFQALILCALSAASLADDATLNAIRDRAMTSEWAYERLADLTDKIGPRPSGSSQAQAAVEQIAAAMKAEGLKVTLQPVRVPHWVRGAESAELTDYPDRPRGITQSLRLTTLGGSVATPPAGITAQVLAVSSFEELTARAAEAKGRIVVFNTPFDQDLADSGRWGRAYQLAGAFRRQGASAAARVGAVAVLVRSVGGANYRLPHTGQMAYASDVTKIPAAALSAEDAMLVHRLAKQGPVSLKLVLTPQSLPDVDSFNVIGDLVGSEKPDEFVVVSGHLDSWDLATGAIDDGAGVAAAMGVVRVLNELKLRPKRTIRVIAWMAEENSGAGAQAYFNANKALAYKHAAAIESDIGAGKPLGLGARIAPSAVAALQPVILALTPIGATAFENSEQPVGSDIGQLQTAGVPGFEPLLDARHYFDYHHTPADTLDKVDPKNLQRMVATMAVLAFHVADMPSMLDRIPPQN
jgi:Iap family predicted aminopeptidase